jgi:hypothetical protein
VQTATIDLDCVVLAHGAHGTREQGMCAMELASYLAGEPHSDHPQCVSPVLGEFLRNWNDSVDDDFRQKLKPFIPRVLNTANDGKDEIRAWVATDWLVRVCAPAWLDLAKLTQHAIALRTAEQISDRASALRVQPVIDDAHSASADAWAAAWDAAWAAARTGMPGLLPGMLPGLLPGLLPWMLPGLLPGLLPWMLPGLLPWMLPGLLPGLMPGLMPGMLPWTDAWAALGCCCLGCCLGCCQGCCCLGCCQGLQPTVHSWDAIFTAHRPQSRITRSHDYRRGNPMKYMIFCAGSMPFVVAFVWMKVRERREQLKQNSAMLRHLKQVCPEEFA